MKQKERSIIWSFSAVFSKRVNCSRLEFVLLQTSFHKQPASLKLDMLVCRQTVLNVGYRKYIIDAPARQIGEWIRWKKDGHPPGHRPLAGIQLTAITNNFVAITHKLIAIAHKLVVIHRASNRSLRRQQRAAQVAPQCRALAQFEG